MARTVAQVVKQYNKKHDDESEQISIFELFEIEDIVIKVRKKK